MKFEFNENELEILRAAVSFLKMNVDDVADALDLVILQADVDALETKIYQTK